MLKLRYLIITIDLQTQFHLLSQESIALVEKVEQLLASRELTPAERPEVRSLLIPQGTLYTSLFLRALPESHVVLLQG